MLARDLDEAVGVRGVREPMTSARAHAAPYLTAGWRLVVASQMSSVRGPTMAEASRRRLMVARVSSTDSVVCEA